MAEIVARRFPAGSGACEGHSRRGADNERVTDQLFLSIWLDRAGRANRFRQFERLLRLFPFSQQEQPQSIISILGVDSTEPPLLERPINGPLDIDEVMNAFKDYGGDDVAYEVESWWDVWTLDAEWTLAPARVLLSCFGPEFDNGTSEELIQQEDLRIDFGVDTHYLPDPEVPGSGRLIESNVKSLLRLVHEIDSALPLSRRQLQTESGENFADRLHQALSGSSKIQ